MAHRFRLIGFMACFAVSAGVSAALADEIPSIDAPDGAFGFADDSATTDVGKFQSTIDFVPSWNNGTTKGRDLGARLEVNTGVLPGLQLGLAAAGVNSRNSPPGEETNTSRAFVLSLPGKWQLRAREVDDFGVAIVFEPSIGRQTNRPQPGSLNYGLDLKIALDTNIGNRFYASFNAGYAVEASAPPVGSTQANGMLYLLLGASYRFFDSLYLGAQIRQAWQYQQTAPRLLAGQALSVGPAVAWKVNDNFTISGVWLRQVAGRDVARPEAVLDLTNFYTNDARIRVTLDF